MIIFIKWCNSFQRRSVMKKKNIVFVLAILIFYSSFVVSLTPCEEALKLPVPKSRVNLIEENLKNSDWYELLNIVVKSKIITSPADFQLVQSKVMSHFFHLWWYGDERLRAVRSELSSSGRTMNHIQLSTIKIIKRRIEREVGRKIKRWITFKNYPQDTSLQTLKKLKQTPLDNPDEILKSIVEAAEAIGTPAFDLLEYVLLDSDVQKALKNSQIKKTLEEGPASLDMYINAAADMLIDIAVPLEHALTRFTTTHPEFMGMQKQLGYLQGMGVFTGIIAMPSAFFAFILFFAYLQTNKVDFDKLPDKSEEQFNEWQQEEYSRPLLLEPFQGEVSEENLSPKYDVTSKHGKIFLEKREKKKSFYIEDINWEKIKRDQEGTNSRDTSDTISE